MFSASITVDLPSQEQQRKKTWFESFKSIFGASYDLNTGVEQLTVDALAVVDGVMVSCDKVGITNAISFMVDRKVIFRDADDNEDDLPAMHRAALSSNILKRKFNEMHVVLTHREDDIHFLFDVRILRQVVLGQAEMSVQCAGRVESLRVQPGEGALDYQNRVRRVTRQPDFIPQHLQAFDRVVCRLADAFRQHIAHVSVKATLARAQVIRLKPKQVAKFRHLRFGAKVETPTYRAVPSRQRHGAYHDPFYYYYYDPYSDLLNYMLLRDMIELGRWNHPELCVVDPDGALICDGEHLHDCLLNEGYEPNAVCYSEGDGVEVQDALSDLDDDASSLSEHDLWQTDDSGAAVDASPPSSNDIGDADDSGRWSSGADADGSGWSSDSSSDTSSSSDDTWKSGSSCGSSSESSSSSCSASSSCSSSSSCGSSCSSSSSCGSSCSSSSSD